MYGYNLWYFWHPPNASCFYIFCILLGCYTSTIFNLVSFSSLQTLTNSYLRQTSYQQRRERDALLVANVEWAVSVCICALVVITRLEICAIFFNNISHNDNCKSKQPNKKSCFTICPYVITFINESTQNIHILVQLFVNE